MPAGAVYVPYAHAREGEVRCPLPLPDRFIFRHGFANSFGASTFVAAPPHRFEGSVLGCIRFDPVQMSFCPFQEEKKKPRLDGDVPNSTTNRSQLDEICLFVLRLSGIRLLSMMKRPTESYKRRLPLEKRVTELADEINSRPHLAAFLVV